MKTKSFWQCARIYFRGYCNSTSVHGFQYFGEKRTVFEKFWWLIIFAICLGACGTSIYLVYQKWEQSPVIVNFANRGTPIYKIPFPAITICPETKSEQKKFNYTDIHNKKGNNINVTDDENIRYEYMSLICSSSSETNGSYSTFPDKFFDFVDEVRPKFDMLSCTYRDKPLTCDKIFKPVLTEEGVCYTLNMLDRSEIFRNNVVHFRNYHKFNRFSTNWSIENGYTDGAGLSTYPRRALLAGAKNGFSFHLVAFSKDLDYLCKNSYQGYKVSVHPPTSLPIPSQDYFRVPLDQSVVAKIQPVMINTSDSVRAYSKQRRRCYFQSERHLQYFKIYSSVNCDIECLANYTLDVCDCVNFYMPRDNTTSICGTEKLECMRDAERDMQLKNLKTKLEKGKAKKKIKSQTECDCLPLCTDLSYDVETSQTDWEWNKWFEAQALESLEGTHLSSLTIYFKSDDFLTSVRNELYGPMDFLANFGGLLGLFTGFSVLSMMEIVYFATVRMICNTRLYGHWSGQDS